MFEKGCDSSGFSKFEYEVKSGWEKLNAVKLLGCQLTGRVREYILVCGTLARCLSATDRVRDGKVVELVLLRPEFLGLLSRLGHVR